MDLLDIFAAIIETSEKEIPQYQQRFNFYKRLMPSMQRAGATPPIECLEMDDAFDDAFKNYREE
jgi:hypothetical protein